jgi:hypothetical protein
LTLESKNISQSEIKIDVEEKVEKVEKVEKIEKID